MDPETFNALIERNPFGTYVVDSSFRLRVISRGARKVFETLHPVEGRDFGEVMRALWPEPFASDAIARFRHTLATGESYSAPNMIERRADIGDQPALSVVFVELPVNPTVTQRRIDRLGLGHAGEA